MIPKSANFAAGFFNNVSRTPRYDAMQLFNCLAIETTRFCTRKAGTNSAIELGLESQIELRRLHVGVHRNDLKVFILEQLLRKILEQQRDII